MYALDNTSLLSAGRRPALNRGLRRVVGGWLAGIWRAWRSRRAIARLTALDNHLLADIGVTRGDVEAALAVPLGQDPARHLAALRAERRLAGRARR